MIASKLTSASRALVAAARDGDRDAAAALWQLHRRWVAAVLLTYKPAEADLEDLLQETAMRLVSKIQTLRDDGNIRAWLRTVAINVARSAGRSSGRLSLVAGNDLSLVSGDAETVDASALEGSARILDRVAALPDEYREPLLLRAVNGMRSKQIADVLGVPPATVDTRIARARRMLRDRLGQTDADHRESNP